jgi:hypothetical protein
VLTSLLLSLFFCFLLNLKSHNTEESIPADVVTDCIDSVFLSADLGNVSSDLEDDMDLYGLYQASGGRILFAI